nr:aminoacyl-tRNA hydrolase [Holospora elegans]
MFCFQGVCILLCKPLSYMNLSGTVVSLLLNMHNIPLRNLVVFHDELELGFGTLRWKIGGGHKGHNGIRNISERCGSDYNRFRVGIGRPSGSAEVSKFVLGAFTPKEKKTFENFIFPVVHQTIPWIIQSNNDKVCGILKETSLLKSSKLSEQF